MSPTAMQERKISNNGRSVGAGGTTSDGRRNKTVDSAAREDRCHPRKLFIGGLPHKTTTQQIREHFQCYGVIADAVVLRWSDGRSRGFGYVTFVEAPAASAALQTVHLIGGRQVDVKRAVPGTNKLFVGGLPQNATANELRDHFESFGSISDAVVLMDPSTGRSRGFGFVCFVAGQEGMTAITAALEQYSHHRIRGKWVEVKSAVPPDYVPADGEDELSLQCGGSSHVGTSKVIKPSGSSLPSTASTATSPTNTTSPKGAQHFDALYEPQKVALPEGLTAHTLSFASALDSLSGSHVPAWIPESQTVDTRPSVHLPNPYMWPPSVPAAAMNLPWQPWCQMPSNFGDSLHFKAPSSLPPSVGPLTRKSSRTVARDGCSEMAENETCLQGWPGFLGGS